MVAIASAGLHAYADHLCVVSDLSVTFFTDRMLLLLPDQQCQSVEGSLECLRSCRIVWSSGVRTWIRR